MFTLFINLNESNILQVCFAKTTWSVLGISLFNLSFEQFLFLLSQQAVMPNFLDLSNLNFQGLCELISPIKANAQITSTNLSGMAVNNVVINTAQTASFLLGEPDPRYIYNFVKSFKVWFERKYCFLLNFNITFPRYILSFAA